MMLCAALCLVQPQDSPRLIESQFTTVEGHKMRLPAPGARATVLLFVAVDCPISNRYVPEYGRLDKEFRPKGVELVRIYVDRAVSEEEVIKHGKDFDITFPAIIDKQHELVRRLQATVTPEAAVVGPDGTMLYRGRISDLYTEHGRAKAGDVRQDLRIALDEITQDKPVSVPFTAAIGCGIPD